jgi:hypothetical protein
VLAHHLGDALVVDPLLGRSVVVGLRGHPRCPYALSSSWTARVRSASSASAAAFCHTSRATSAVFDDPNLMSSAGLVPVVSLARSAGLGELAQQHLTVPDKGANAGLKVSSLVAGMVVGADSIDDMALLRHGGMGRVFDHGLRALDVGFVPAGVTFGHVANSTRSPRGSDQPGPPRSVGRRVRANRWAGDGRHRRHHHRGPRLRQAGFGLRLLRGPWPQHPARHHLQRRVGSGGRGPTPPQRLVRPTTWCEATCRPRLV